MPIDGDDVIIELIEKLCEDSDTRWPQRDPWRELTSEGRLLSGLQELIRGHEIEALSRCRELLNSPEAYRGIAYHYAGEGTALEEKARPIHEKAKALVMLAHAAALNGDLTKERTYWDEMVRELQEAAHLITPQKASKFKIEPCEFYKTGPIWHALDSLDRKHCRVNGVRYWLGCLFGCEQLERRRIPVLGVAGQDGFLAHLTLVKLSDQGGELAPAPETAFQTFGPCLIDTLAQQHRRQAGNVSVGWSLTLQRGEFDASLSKLDGSSLGAAAAVGFHLLATGKIYDARCAITAKVEPGSGAPLDDKLQPVADVEKKLEAFSRYAGATSKRAGLAASDPMAQEPKVSELRTRFHPLQIEGLATVRDAVTFCSAEIEELRSYLRAVIEATETAAVTASSRKVAEVYIEPDVLKRQPRSARLDEDKMRSRTQSRRVWLDPESLEPGEDWLYRESLSGGEEERRVTWESERKQFVVGRHRYTAIIGVPGGGKSTLVDWTARRIAEEALAMVENRRTQEPEGAGPRSVPLPVKVKFSDLSNVKGNSQNEREASLRDVIACVLERNGCKGEALKYLKDHLHEDQVWLFIDALDETYSNTALATCLDALAKWRGRVVLTSRPYGWDEAKDQLGRQVTEYRLAPFSSVQRDQFIRRWFRDDETKCEQVRQLVRETYSLQTLGQVPLLLGFVCAISENERLSGDITRARLYGQVMDRLFGSAERAQSWQETLERLVWSSFKDRNPRDPYVSADQLRDALEDDRPEPQDPQAVTKTQQIDSLVKELKTRRVLIPYADERAFVFPHRSFAEYLMGCALARRV